MAQPMSPSEITPITSGQIAKFLDLLTAGLRKSGLPSEPTQLVLETQGDALVTEFVGSVRKRVDAISEMIVRHVTVNRNLTPQDTLDATGRKQYTDRNVVKGVPRGEGAEVAVCFFKLGRYASPAEVDEAYKLRGLTPDPIAQAKVNTDDPAFADEHPNGTQWQDADGKWCFATFSRWSDKRMVNVHRSGDDWNDHWWFAGVRK